MSWLSGWRVCLLGWPSREHEARTWISASKVVAALGAHVTQFSVHLILTQTNTHGNAADKGGRLAPIVPSFALV